MKRTKRIKKVKVDPKNARKDPKKTILLKFNQETELNS